MTIRARQQRATPTSDDEYLLDLGDVTSATVCVILVDGSPAFGSSGRGPFFTAGLAWSCRQDSLDITFELGINIRDLSSTSENLTFGQAEQGQQQCTVRPSDTHTHYHFTVEQTSGLKHDPKIVVTPI